MRNNNILAALILVLAGAIYSASAQTSDPLKPSLVTGDVRSVVPGSIVLATKDGELKVVLSEKTEYKRVAAENPSLKTASPAALSDIAVGDRLAVTGVFGADRSSLPARSVYLMTKADITARHTKESEEWKTRGITGRVTAVDPQTKEIKVEMRGLAAATSTTLTPKDNATILRYAPNSIKFDEAVPSSLADIKTGDMLRALGDKSSDGTTFSAEKIVTGAFQTVGGTVRSVDTAKNEVVLTDLKSKKDIVVSLGDSSILKKFPEEMAARMAAFQGGQGVRPPGAGEGGRAPQAGGQTAGGGQGRGGFGAGRGNIDEMFDRFPTIAAADLKPGDMVVVSSTRSSVPDHITAIKLLSGIEPFVRAAQASGSRTNVRSGQGDFNLPGLEGFGTP
jgi:hypothetical protein